MSEIFGEKQNFASKSGILTRILVIFLKSNASKTRVFERAFMLVPAWWAKIELKLESFRLGLKIYDLT